MKKNNFIIVVTCLVAMIMNVDVASAAKVNANISTCFGAEWNSGTNTMTWTGANGKEDWHLLWSGLPAGDISTFTMFHAVLSDFSDNADHIRLRIKDKSGNYADANLVEGVNEFSFTDLAATFPNCDFTQIEDITIWGCEYPVDGTTIDNEHVASVVIQDMYVMKMDVKTTTTLNDEITDLSYLTNGGTFVIANSTDTSLLTWLGSAAGASATTLNGLTDEMYYYYHIEALPQLDVDGDGALDSDQYYRVAIQKQDGSVKPSNWWGDNYVNIIDWGDLWSTTCDEGKENGYGRDGQYYAVWTITYDTEANGFVFYNKKRNLYMRVAGSQKEVNYLHLYKSVTVEYSVPKRYNDTIFKLTDASGYDEETGVMTDGKWTFENPVNLDWSYLVIATANTAADASHEIKLTDSREFVVKGEDYDGQSAGTGAAMWLDYWNNQNIACISLDQLKIANGLDISSITSLEISGTVRPSAVYLTDYPNPKITNRGRWTLYVSGDDVRTYSETGKFGTVCLPYAAAFTGAEVYSIASADQYSVTLERTYGILEPGKPYIFQTTDEVGHDNAGEERNVHFFRADFDSYDVTVAKEVNGLVGTINGGNKVPAGCYILSNNKIMKVVQGNEPTATANRAWFDLSKVSSSSNGVKGKITFSLDEEATAIQDVNTQAQSIANGVIYDLSGRVVTKPTRGLYVINGKKVIIK